MAVTGIDNWEYGRWTYIIGRSLRFNEAAGAELAAAKAFVTFIRTKRPWLLDRIFHNSEEAQGLVTTDNPQIVGKTIMFIGKDIMWDIPVQDAAEKTEIDTLITATGNRRFGDKGNVGGADVTQVP